MKCPFCKTINGAEKDNIEAWDVLIYDHLIVTINCNNEAHIHGPIYNPNKMKRMIEEIGLCMGWEINFDTPPTPKVQINTRQLMIPDATIDP